MDPHTAVAGHVLRQYRLKTGDMTPTILVSTASPYKFAADVLNAVRNRENGTDDAFSASEELERLTGIPMPEQVKRLKDLPVRHQAVCEKNQMGQAVLEAFQ